MPLYEYECSKCHHRFEKIEKVSASETQKCPKCGGKAQRQISRSAIQFKGSGWYVTDYAGKGKEPPAGKTEAASGDSGAGKAGESAGEKAGSTAGKTGEGKTGGEKAGAEKSSREKSGGGKKGKKD